MWTRDWCSPRPCRAAVEQVAGIESEPVAELRPGDLAGTVARHPLQGQGYDFGVPLYPGAFVTDSDGTGFVHIAPGHGVDDFELGQAHGLEVPQTVAGDGTYYAHVPLFGGVVVYRPNGKPGDANDKVLAAIDAAGGLLARGKLTHSYPHSWRSKAPLIFRNTPQWFISMETNGLRQKALAAIAATRWVPPQGENRIRAMIESRPDWCISRQRAWGVPIAVFVDKATGQPLRDQAVVDRIADAMERDGSDIWFSADPAVFLGNRYDPAKYEKVTDIVEVWFESGASHSYVLEKRPDLKWPASLYLEGSDQHRGWFHSSLLESCGTRGRAPYEAVLTHGFVLDEQGRKMSKSLGNVVSPQEVVERSGADILRLWVVASDYSEDLRIGPEILKYHADMYRRLRNTLRYLVGNLAGFSERERVDVADMPELERWVLDRLAETDALVRETSQSYDFHTMFTALHNLCAVDLSAFYFDVRKDVLYCDRPDSLRRRAARTVLDRVFDSLARWLAPVLCFTAEEAWLARHGEAPEVSVHLEGYPELPASWRDEALGSKWARLRDLRRVVTGALEMERAQKRLGSSLQGAARLYVPEEYREALAGVDLAELCITSEGTVVFSAPPEGAFALPDVPGVGAVIERASGRDLPSLLAGPTGGRRGRRPSRALPPLCRRGGPSRTRRKRVTRGLGVALLALTVLVDQLSKSWVVAYFDAAAIGGSPAAQVPQRVVTPFFNLVLTWNRGMSFGLFNRDATWNAALFSLLAVVIVAALMVWLWRTESVLVAAGIGLVAGSAIGNVIDRLRLGAVTDFLDFHWGDWHFATFNVADSAITVGVALLLLDALLYRREKSY